MSIKLSEKIRGKNYTEEEKNSLIECIKPYKNIIQWPMTDKKSNERKALAWNEITKHYNSRNAVQRDTKSLVGLYKHMKMLARKGNFTIHFKKEDLDLSDSTSMPSEDTKHAFPPFSEIHIDDSITKTDEMMEHPYEPCEDEMSYTNSNDVVRNYIESNNLLKLDEKSELEIELLKAKKALAVKHLEIAEVELQIKKTILEKERRALEQMNQT